MNQGNLIFPTRGFPLQQRIPTRLCVSSHCAKATRVLLLVMPMAKVSGSSPTSILLSSSFFATVSVNTRSSELGSLAKKPHLRTAPPQQIHSHPPSVPILPVSSPLQRARSVPQSGQLRRRFANKGTGGHPVPIAVPHWKVGGGSVTRWTRTMPATPFDGIASSTTRRF